MLLSLPIEHIGEIATPTLTRCYHCFLPLTSGFSTLCEYIVCDRRSTEMSLTTSCSQWESAPIFIRAFHHFWASSLFQYRHRLTIRLCTTSFTCRPSPNTAYLFLLRETHAERCELVTYCLFCVKRLGDTLPFGTPCAVSCSKRKESKGASAGMSR
jgi:hypothetical protein